MAITLSDLSEDDIADCCVMAEHFHRESLVESIPFEKEAVANYFRSCRQRPNYLVKVAKSNNRCIGALVGSLSNYVFSNDYTLCTSMFIYVRPEYRFSRAATIFIRELIDWAQNNGASEIFFSTSSGIGAKGLGRLLEKNDFLQVGGTYRRNIGHFK